MTKDPTGEFASDPATALAGGYGPGAALADQSFFGHPRGLATLFFTELWERFSYYGMRAILILFMTAPVAAGGLEFDTATAGAIYGLYTAFVYLVALPGGWIADRIVGQRRAVLYGGIVIAAGHFSMAIPTLTTFYLGLALIVVGTGLLKPNISTMVGELYPEGGARRDAGFSIFYMGINIGAFVAPLVCGFLGEKISWHLGFGAAGVGMVLGIIQYLAGDKYLGEAGRQPNAGEAERASGIRYLALGVTLVVVLVGGMLLLGNAGVVDLSVTRVAGWGTGIIVALALAYFAYVYIAAGLTPVEKKRLGAIGLLFIFSALFWSGFEQAGSSLNLVAERLTDRNLFGWEMPASWLQSVNPIFIIALAPVFAWLWVALSRRRAEPSSPAKFGMGLILLALGFAVMVWATMMAAQGVQVSPTWLVVTYFFHTTGELALSPVGLSTVTKLAPHRMVGQMMGVWFMSISLGNLIAGQVAGQFEEMPLPQLFGIVTLITGGAGLLLLLLARPMRRLMQGVH
jgi:proton-dependent oligopeptide transporter, POT family